jgi:hypothetical protein
MGGVIATADPLGYADIVDAMLRLKKVVAERAVGESESARIADEFRSPTKRTRSSFASRARRRPSHLHLVKPR